MVEAIESVVLDLVSAHRLVCCPYFERASFSRELSPDVVEFWDKCCLSKKRCGFHGRRYKFRPCSGGVRVVWTCSMLVGLPDLER